MDYHAGKTALPPEALERLRLHARSLLGELQPVASEPDAVPAPRDATPTDATPENIPAETSDAAQRRHADRHKTLLSAKLVFNNLASVVDCFVCDLSEGGARIKLAAPMQLPPVLILRFNDGRYHNCRIRRRAGLELGVEFTD